PVKVCCVEKIVTVGDAEGCALVNGDVIRFGGVAVIDGDNGVRLIQRRVPPRNGTIFTDEDEQRGVRSSIQCDRKKPGVVKDVAVNIAAANESRPIFM